MDQLFEKTSKKLAKKVAREFTLNDVRPKVTGTGSVDTTKKPVNSVAKNSAKVHSKKSSKISTASAPVKK